MRFRIVTTGENLIRDAGRAWHTSQPELCQECEHELLDSDVLKCPTCTAADHYEGPIQTQDF